MLFSSRTTKPLDLDDAAEMLRRHLDLKFKPALRGMPTYDFVLALDGVDETRPLTTDDTFVYALDAIDRHSREAEELFRMPRENALVWDVHVGIDLPTGLADAEVWCPMEASFPLFGDLNLALMQMRAPVMGADGRNVNVVIIDQGINSKVLRQRVPGANFLGGWFTPEFDKGGPPGPFKLIPPGGWRDDGLGSTVTHGTKMASLVLAVAPRARILDLALLPSHILKSARRRRLPVLGDRQVPVARKRDCLAQALPRLQRAMGPEQFLGRVQSLYGFPAGPPLELWQQPEPPAESGSCGSAARRHRRRLRCGELRPVLPGRPLRRWTDRPGPQHLRGRRTQRCVDSGGSSRRRDVARLLIAGPGRPDLRLHQARSLRTQPVRRCRRLEPEFHGHIQRLRAHGGRGRGTAHSCVAGDPVARAAPWARRGDSTEGGEPGGDG